MLTSIENLRTHFVAEIDKPLGWFNTRFGQSFTVLTCCRMLHTLQSGAVKSKLAAVQWADQSPNAEWNELVRQAWAERKGVRFGVKVRQPADVKLLQETARFVAYAQNELSLQAKGLGEVPRCPPNGGWRRPSFRGAPRDPKRRA